MAAQSFLAKNGMRTGLLGSAAALAIAFSATGAPDAGTAANRTGWFADLTGGSEAISTVVAASTIETITANGIELNQGGLLFNERAAVPAAPGTAKGYLWLKNDAPNVLVFTDDTGADTVLGGAGGLLVDAGVGTDNYGTTSIGALATAAAGAGFNLAIGNSALAAVSTGDANIAHGHQASQAATGNHTIAIGHQAGASATGGNDRTVVGSQAYLAGTGGAGHTAIGRFAMRYGRTSTANADTSIAIGRDAMLGDPTPANNTGVANIGIGYQALSAVSNGGSNIAIGNTAGSAITTGNLHVAVGVGALQSVTTNGGNVGVGYRSGNLLTGTGNVMMGTNAGRDATTANSNTIIGNNAGLVLGSGDDNVMVGRDAGNQCTGSENVFIGARAGADAATGFSIVAIGAFAYEEGTQGRSHVAIGHYAMEGGRTSISDNTHSIAIGYEALQGDIATPANNSGTDNIAIGSQALLSCLGGGLNIAVGNQTAGSITTGAANVAMGDQALAVSGADSRSIVAVGFLALGAGGSNESEGSVAVGSRSMEFGRVTASVADSSIAIGYQALRGSATTANNTGVSNIALGYQSLTAVEGGARNIALGAGAGASLTSASDNILIGDSAGNALITTGLNLAIGNSALAIATAGSSVAIGHQALSATTGVIDTVAIGNTAGNTVTSGASNTIVGSQADVLAGTDSQLVAIGTSAEAASRSTVIGWNANASGNDSVAIGHGTTANFSNAIAIGAGAAATANNQLVFGSDPHAISDVYFGDGVTSPTPASSILNATGGSGTDIAGANITIAGGKGTGTGAGGNIVFQTAPAGATGAVANALTTVATISELGMQIDRAVWTPTVALVDGANISTDASLSTVFSVTLGGNRTLDNPTNLQDGATYIWVITQDGAGGHTLAYGSAFLWPGGTAPTLSAGAGDVDVISAVSDGTNLYASIQQDFS